MPRMTGLELLRELRSFGITSDVVMVTAANDSKTVDALLKLGVADYLVKPFTARRFQQALDKFCRQRSAIATHSSVSQEELDALFSGSSGPEDVPKGLQSRTLERIRTHLAQAPEEGCTCESLAAQAGLSSVTVRRYLTYLTQQGEVVSRVNYDTGGRPSLLYYLPKGGPRLCLSDSSPADLAGSFFFYFQCGNFPRFDLKFCWASTCIFPQHPV
jgi:response regulator of citrate/malate metabolism